MAEKNKNIERENVIPLNYGEFWHHFNSEILKSTKDIIEEKYGKIEDKEEREEKLESLLERERAFTKILIKTVSELEERGQKNGKILLFDIDETIGSNYYDSNENKIKTVLRPSLPYILRMIKDNFPDLIIGFLTSRGKESLAKQIDNGDFSSIESFLDKKYLFSSKEYANQLEPTSEEETKQYLLSHPLTNKDKVKDFSFGEHPWLTGDFQKMEALKKINFNDKDVAVIDDFYYPEFFNFGHSLFTEGGFFV